MMHSGTINVRLKSPLSISKHDVETPAIEWEPNRRESFKIVRALIQIPMLEVIIRELWRVFRKRQK